MRRRWRELRGTPLGEFARRLLRRFRASHPTLLAAALAYYAAFSLGPLLLLLGGWLGVVIQTRPELAERYRALLNTLVTQVMPLQENSAEVVAASVEAILLQLSQGALLRSVLSLLVLVWASSGFFISLQLALEVIFDDPGARGFLRKRLVAVLLVVAVALVMGVEIVGGALLAPLAELLERLASGLGAPELAPPPLLGLWVMRASTVLLRLALSALAFTLAFRYLPRRSSSWRGAVAGGVFSAVSVALSRQVLVRLIDADRFNLIYGVITSVVLTLLWLYLALFMFLIGALLAAEVSAGRRRSLGRGGRGE